jgi:uncharacterized protein YeaO (DUF488 family)
VDRLWPRGLRKESSLLDEWLKELAPTDRLRNWFDHDPDYWQQFKRKYKTELNHNPLLKDFVERMEGKEKITLLYATKYDHLTHALILKEVIEASFTDEG